MDISNKSIIVYDGECDLCTTLAKFMQRHAPNLVFQTFTDFQATKQSIDPMLKSSLGVYREGSYLHGTEAWQWMLAEHPDLQGLNWLAGKLGLTKTVSRSLEILGHTARRLCLSCRR